jgi:DNA ligase-3
MSDAKFSVDYSKRTSNCKKCKKQLPKNALRLAKHVFNHFSGDSDEMKTYFHVDCLFDTFKRAKATTKIIESTDDIKEFKNIQEVDKKTILKLIKEIEKVRTNKKTSNSKQKASNKSNENSRSDKNLKKDENSEAEGHNDPKDDPKDDPEENPTDKEDDPDKDDENNNKDDSVKFDEFQDVCSDISNQSGKAKTQVLRKFLENLSKASQVYKFLKLLLPSVCNRVYNLNSKQLVKLFSRIFDVDLDDMTDHLNQGDVAQTIREYFAKSENVKPAKTSTLTLNEVDDYLDKLTKITKEQDQYNLLKQITKKCTKNDLRTFVRLIKKDLRLDAGSKLILDAISPNAYAAFQVSRDLKDVVERTFALKKHNHKAVLKKDLSIRVSLMTPIKPMLAEACKSVDIAFKKCKNGIYAETKYDGERLQIHKNGNQFRYFSRNLKEVQPHKVAHLKEFIPKSIPNANQLILDGEVLLYDHITKKPLPFGTLGVHKKNQFKDATVCLYVFDCLYLNGRDLMNE